MKCRIALFVLLSQVCITANAQLRPGFDAAEYLELLSISSLQFDTVLAEDITPAPSHFSRIYRSPVSGLDNRWELWLRSDQKQAVISIRGTINSPASWLANIYAAMQPATGTIQISDSLRFSYKLAENPAAAIHTGWLIALASISNTVREKILENYRNGIKEFLIMGHSQGGAIAYLLRSYLYYETIMGNMPGDIVFKTYCSAAPKPGNLYYAYDYDFITRGGWAFNVVNALDWVPETPFSIQKVTDFNPINPFADIRPVLKKQKLLIRLYGGFVYGKLTGSTRRAVRRYKRYLGKKLEKPAHKVLPGLKLNGYAHTLNYMRAGTPVVLMPDDAYNKQFPDSPQSKNRIWTHHMIGAYYTLTKKWYSQ